MNQRAIITLFVFAFASVRSGFSTEAVSYQDDVVPILETYCVGCHSQDDSEGGLSLASYEQLMAGGESGLAITEGTPSSSRLLLMLTGKLDPVMPPEDEERPTNAEIELITAWVEQGAKGPKGRPTLKRNLRISKIAANPDVELPVTAIAISPDGGLRAIARYGMVEVRDSNERLVAKLSKELDKVNGLEFSRDGSRLLVASGVPGAYGNAAMFDVESGELLSEWVGHRDTLYAASFSPDESIVATAGYDREIILWSTSSGAELRRLRGHNGAIFDLAFSPNGKVLCSACADETVKVWNVANGERLDTLGQPGGEVYAVDFTPDGNHVLAASSDNRLRVWKLMSVDRPAINPLIATRFVDESPLVDFTISRDGGSLIAMGQSGSLKVLRTSDWRQMTVLEHLGEVGSDLAVTADGKLMVAMMSGGLIERSLPKSPASVERTSYQAPVEPVYLELGDLKLIKMSDGESSPKMLPRGAILQEAIGRPGEVDKYHWQANVGEVWAIDVDPRKVEDDDQPRLDPIVSVHDEAGVPVLQVRLQAVQDTYFTFRGKDSKQTSDFRLFNWQELNLDDYLYSAGEVTKLWMHPRGPDSGFNVYPGAGNRWTYFGTTHTTHALGESAYIVRPLRSGEAPLANGLPVFDVYFENDDDPQRNDGTSSRLLFATPKTGRYTIHVSDARAEGGEKGFAYELKLRAASPRFEPSVGKIKSDIRRGTGREFSVRIKRYDGFSGPVTFSAIDVPEGINVNLPLTIEHGQNAAVGTVWVQEDASWSGKKTLSLVASADINGRRVERVAGSIGEFELADPPSAIPSIQPVGREVEESESWVLQVRRGTTVTARVRIRRKSGFTNEVRFGNETSGRNASQGVYVDNIGLNGLLIIPDSDEREFFLTADPTATPGQRSFFLTAQIDGNVTTHPIVVEVLP